MKVINTSAAFKDVVIIDFEETFAHYFTCSSTTIANLSVHPQIFLQTFRLSQFLFDEKITFIRFGCFWNFPKFIKIIIIIIIITTTTIIIIIITIISSLILTIRIEVVGFVSNREKSIISLDELRQFSRDCKYPEHVISKSISNAKPQGLAPNPDR